MIVIYTSRVTNRIQYVMDFVFREYFGLDYRLDTEPAPAEPGHIYINYSNTEQPGYFSIFQDDLLLSDIIEPQKLFVSRENGMPVFFQTTDRYHLRFDIFSAIFFLITRYEEYLPHDKDIHGRYRPENSILSNEAFQFCPVVETWLSYLKAELLKRDQALVFKTHQFEFEPTFDIDNAFAYKGRRWPKSLALLARPAAWPVILQNRRDPYDTLDEILLYLDKIKARARFFFLLNDRGSYNSVVNPKSALLHERIRMSTLNHGFGIHPSYHAMEENSIGQEKDMLEKIVGIPAEHSRQHFLRIGFPDYYNNLIQAGIRYDHSLGYSEQPGFRAGFSRPFWFYNLEDNRQTNLRINPFSFMDATFIYYKKASLSQIIKKILEINDQVSKVNGKLVTISHNDLLGITNQVNFWKVLENCAV